MPKRLAVVGGGPKAAALAAKVDFMRRAGDTIELVVFEKAEWGAAWSGRHGYTDGQQHLCTPAERDVGFPYQPGVLDADQTADLYKKFSWASFLVAQAPDYRTWVDRGRRSPTHSVYAEYLAWVLKGADVVRHIAEVTEIHHVNEKWSLVTSKGTFGDFDGVVLTGPGPAQTGFTRPSDPRVIDGTAYWTRPTTFFRGGGKSEEPIVIAGSGGTAAAIAANLAKQSKTKKILIIGNQAALFTRAESYFENSLYSDNDAWLAIAPAVRQEFTVRLSRGVVWANVSHELSSSPNISFLPGRVKQLTILPPIKKLPGVLSIEYTNHQGLVTVAASLVVDAAGFDPWWFSGFLAPAIRASCEGANAAVTRQLRQGLVDTMKEDLSLDIASPGLHVPMVSQTQGPGFGSLMVLGTMSDRILAPYQTHT